MQASPTDSQILLHLLRDKRKDTDLASQVRKAAILIDSLSCDDALALLARLDGTQVTAVASALVRAGSISTDEQRAVFLEFVARRSAPYKPVTSNKSASAVPFDFLHALAGDELLSLLIEEHPQTIALVAAHLPRAVAVTLLTALPAGLQSVVIRAIAGLRSVESQILDDVAEMLCAKLAQSDLGNEAPQPLNRKRSLAVRTLLMPELPTATFPRGSAA
jgi:flagellar motor switch protein FliG